MLIPDINNFKLPIIPKEYSFREPSTSKTVNLLNFGEYILNEIPKAKEISFSCFFPSQEYSLYACYN